MANVRTLAYLPQRMLERAEDAAVALRAAIGPSTADLGTLQQQQRQQLQQHWTAGGGGSGIELGGHDDEDDAEDGIDGTGRGGAARDAGNPYLQGILTALDSSSDEARIDGLRRIIAAIAAGRYRIAHAALPAVLKLTSSSITSPHVRKLVSIILARSASAQPDLALLAVNSFQRDLSHHSPLIRASALRALGSLRIPVLAPILRLAIATAARDSHPHVRRVAALSLSKAYVLDVSALPELVSLLSLLLNDRSPAVLGAALVAYSALGYPDPQTAATASTSAYDYDDGNDAPSVKATQADDLLTESRPSRQQYALLHPFYRKLCYALADMDEWTQAHALDVLLLYARSNFTKPETTAQPSVAASGPGSSASGKGKQQDIEAFLAEDDQEPVNGAPSSGPSTSVHDGSNEKARARRNADLDLLLSRAQALLMSRNPAVVLAVARLNLFLSTPTSSSSYDFARALVRPLLRFVRPSTSTPPELAYLSIVNLTHLINTYPPALVALQPHLAAFLPRSASAEEPTYLSMAKIDILVALCTRNVVGAGWVLSELEWLSKTADAAMGAPVAASSGTGGVDDAGQVAGGRLAQRAIDAVGEVVVRLRQPAVRVEGISEEEEKEDEAEVEEITQRALDILLRLIRKAHQAPEGSGRAKSKTGGGKRSALGHAEALQPGVVARAITVLRSLLHERSAAAAASYSSSSGSLGAPTGEPSKDELSTGRILAHFPALLFGAPTSNANSTSTASSTTTTTTTTVNAEGKTVQIIRRPRVMGRHAIRDPHARANLFWLLGQHLRTRVAVTSASASTSSSSSSPATAGERTMTLAELVGPDLLRRAALTFGEESVGAKLEIVTLAAKVGAFLPSVAATGGAGTGTGTGTKTVVETVEALVGYVMQLGRYDASYDVRDRARFCKALGRALGVQHKRGKTSGLPSASGQGGSVSAEGQAANGKDGAQGTETKDGELDALGSGLEEEEEVGGVTLRREQVLMILFEGKNVGPPPGPPTTTSSEAPASTDRGEEEDTSFGTLALALTAATAQSASSLSSSGPGRGSAKRRLLLRGWQRTAVPPWATADEATPAHVRDPPPLSTTTTSTSTTSSLPPADQGSAASRDGARLGPVADTAPGVEARAERAVERLASRAAAEIRGGLGSGSASTTAGAGGEKSLIAPLVHHPSSASGGGAGSTSRYKDLDDFLAEDEDEEMEVVEVELDEPAPEDEEYEDEEEEEECEEEEEEGRGRVPGLPEGSESNAWAS